MAGSVPHPALARAAASHPRHARAGPRRAYALGVFFGFSPFLGLHTVLGLAFAFLFSLNRVAVLLGVYSNLPWILPAYYTLATIAGAAILGVDVQPRALEEAMRGGVGRVVGRLRRLGAPLAPSDVGLHPRLDDRRGPARGGRLPRVAR